MVLRIYDSSLWLKHECNFHFQSYKYRNDYLRRDYNNLRITIIVISLLELCAFAQKESFLLPTFCLVYISFLGGFVIRLKSVQFNAWMFKFTFSLVFLFLGVFIIRLKSAHNSFCLRFILHKYIFCLDISFQVLFIFISWNILNLSCCLMKLISIFFVVKLIQWLRI